MYKVCLLQFLFTRFDKNVDLDYTSQNMDVSFDQDMHCLLKNLPFIFCDFNSLIVLVYVYMDYCNVVLLVTA